ncbi:aldo/keto reductase [Oceanispirochaeta crateris]|nr:aldo/keto reductase [Oceanispirochaeta crateris]
MNSKSRLLKKIPGLSPLSFGAWALGGEYWGPQSHHDSVRAIHRALAMNVNYFDTAPVYGKGRSEQLIGQQIKKFRSEIILGTKAFYTTPEKMKTSLETSLRRLLTDYIDIFYIHWPLSGVDMRPGMEMLESLRQEGKIRAIGVSNFTVDQMKLLEGAGSIDVYQGGYNLFWSALEQKLLPYLSKRNIGFIPYGVLAQGILTESGMDHLDRNHEGYRHKMILYREDIIERIRPWLQRLLEESSRTGIPLEQAVALFTLNHLSADTVLLGVRNRSQAERNFQMVKDGLPPSFSSLLQSIKTEAEGLFQGIPNLFNHKS